MDGEIDEVMRLRVLGQLFELASAEGKTTLHFQADYLVDAAAAIRFVLDVLLAEKGSGGLSG